jgi:hypothetical protein
MVEWNSEIASRRYSAARSYIQILAVVRPILLVRRQCLPLSADRLEEVCQDYTMLSAATAERVLRFWQVRESNRG